MTDELGDSCGAEMTVTIWMLGTANAPSAVACTRPAGHTEEHNGHIDEYVIWFD